MYVISIHTYMGFNYTISLNLYNDIEYHGVSFCIILHHIISHKISTEKKKVIGKEIAIEHGL